MPVSGTRHQRFTPGLIRGQKPELSLMMQMIREVHFEGYCKNPVSLLGQRIPHRGNTLYWFLRHDKTCSQSWKQPLTCPALGVAKFAIPYANVSPALDTFRRLTAMSSLKKILETGILSLDSFPPTKGQYGLVEDWS